MKFSYENKGDILYGIEEFRFRYSGRETATIKVLNLLDDNQYAYEFEVMEHYKLPDKIDKYQASFSSANMELHEELNIKHQPVFNTKQEALQHAIGSLNAIMKLCVEINKGYSLHKNKHTALNSWLVTCESNILVWFSNARDEPYDRLFTKEMTIDEIKKWCKFREYKVIGTFEIKRDSALGITFINPISYQKDGKSFNVRSIYIFKKRKPKI